MAPITVESGDYNKTQVSIIKHTFMLHISSVNTVSIFAPVSECDTIQLAVFMTASLREIAMMILLSQTRSF
jgi:hypothetical protein